MRLARGPQLPRKPLPGPLLPHPGEVGTGGGAGQQPPQVDLRGAASGRGAGQRSARARRGRVAFCSRPATCEPRQASQAQAQPPTHLQALGFVQRSVAAGAARAGRRRRRAPRREQLAQQPAGAAKEAGGAGVAVQYDAAHAGHARYHDRHRRQLHRQQPAHAHHRPAVQRGQGLHWQGCRRIQLSTGAFGGAQGSGRCGAGGSKSRRPAWPRGGHATPQRAVKAAWPVRGHTPRGRRHHHGRRPRKHHTDSQPAPHLEDAGVVQAIDEEEAQQVVGVPAQNRECQERRLRSRQGVG